MVHCATTESFPGSFTIDIDIVGKIAGPVTATSRTEVDNASFDLLVRLYISNLDSLPASTSLVATTKDGFRDSHSVDFGPDGVLILSEVWVLVQALVDDSLPVGIASTTRTTDANIERLITKLRPSGEGRPWT